MTGVAAESRPRYSTFADILERVGHVPAERILPTPEPGTATVVDVLRLAEGHPKRVVELVGGVLVEKPMGLREDYLGAWLIYLLQDYVTPKQLGAVLGSQALVRFNLDVVRMPDVTFIRWDSLDDPDLIEDPAEAFLDISPDFVIEVLSPSNTAKEMAIKLGEYAAAGVRLVWYVDPDAKEVTVYPKGKERGKKVLGLDGVLDGGSVLPGFTLPVAKIFEKRAPTKKLTKKRRG